MKSIKATFKEVFDLNLDNASSDEIHDNIVSGARIKGTNAAILILAILIASIGLNTNSIAVIIGAMLISPLMGGIIAIGYGIGIDDLSLSKNAFLGLLFQVFISIITAAIYFHFSGSTNLAGTHELLARTSPALSDVGIAICGGFAGIIGITRKEKTNVIPGVAIATALMPPLCTAGYGLATGQLQYFLGAFYLFFINSFFICVTTIIVVKALKLPVKQGLSLKQKNKIHLYIVIIAILTIIPSAFISYNIYEDIQLDNNVADFVDNEFHLDGVTVLNSTVNQNKTELTVIVMGDSLDNNTIHNLQNKMKDYNLGSLNLNIQNINNTR